MDSMPLCGQLRNQLFNWTLAGIIVGVVGGVAVAYLASSLPATSTWTLFAVSPHCGRHPPGRGRARASSAEFRVPDAATRVAE